jgi:hypothetical protein
VEKYSYHPFFGVGEAKKQMGAIFGRFFDFLYEKKKKNVDNSLVLLYNTPIIKLNQNGRGARSKSTPPIAGKAVAGKGDIAEIAGLLFTVPRLVRHRICAVLSQRLWSAISSMMQLISFAKRARCDRSCLARL